MLKLIAAAALASVGSTVAADAKGDPQYALTPVKVQRVPVSYADLDLSSPAGAQMMLERLERAANQACGVDLRATNRRVLADAKACAREAVADAVAELRAPMVTALHEDPPRDMNLASVSE